MDLTPQAVAVGHHGDLLLVQATVLPEALPLPALPAARAGAAYWGPVQWGRWDPAALAAEAAALLASKAQRVALPQSRDPLELSCWLARNLVRAATLPRAGSKPGLRANNLPALCSLLKRWPPALTPLQPFNEETRQRLLEEPSGVFGRQGSGNMWSTWQRRGSR